MNHILRKYEGLLGEHPDLRAYITKLEKEHKEHKQLFKLAYEDPNTKLGNKRRFDQDLAEAMLYASRLNIPLTVGSLDMNGFRDVNNTFGHEAGDWVLERVGEIIRGYDNAYRIGGDEFGLILPFLGKEDACTLASRMYDRINEIRVDEKQFKPIKGKPAKNIQISASIGLATYPGDAKTSKGLVKLADERMYAAKRNGTVPIYRAKLVCSDIA